jgi:hypothetical protein
MLEATGSASLKQGLDEEGSPRYRSLNQYISHKVEILIRGRMHIEEKGHAYHSLRAGQERTLLSY